MPVPFPRNDFVVVKVNTVDKVKGIAVPQNSLQGQEYVVVRVGPKVENLNVGDKVLLTGREGSDWSFIPNFDKLLIIKEGNILLVFKEDANG